MSAFAEQIDRDLRAIRQRLRQPVESEFSRGELTGTQRSVMQALVHSSGLSLHELSRRMGLAHSTLSGVVDRLQQRGLVRRKTDGRDRRISRILPSKSVQDFMRDTLPRLEIHPLIEALRHANPQERAAIRQGLEILRRLLETPD